MDFAQPIWRYLSLAKYVDLLRTRSLYFPKASLFRDDTEGKWIAHVLSWGEAQRWIKAMANARLLEKLLERAGGDDSAILNEANKLLASKNESLGDVLRGVLQDVSRVYPHKRREYLVSMVASWHKHYDNHNSQKDKWISQVAIIRESTYISCWNRSTSMSLAMWELYGGGLEGVAVRSTEDKLKTLIDDNAKLLGELKLAGGVAAVRYLEGVHAPNEKVRENVLQILTDISDVRIGEFSIKPSIYEYEQEVRAVIFPKRGTFDPIVNPLPETSGIALPIGGNDKADQHLIAEFVEAVYVHPAVGRDSMIYRVVAELHQILGVTTIPIIADRIEAFGQSISVQPI